MNVIALKNLGLNHWIIQRLSVFFFLLFLILKCFYSLDISVLFFLTSYFHIFLGINVIVDDYVHDNHLSSCSSIFLGVSITFLLKNTFILFI